MGSLCLFDASTLAEVLEGGVVDSHLVNRQLCLFNASTSVDVLAGGVADSPG